MKHNWSLVVVIFYMLGAGAADWLSSWYVQRLQTKDKSLIQSANDMRIRTDGAVAEAAQYREIEHLAALVQDQIRWEPDSTRLMRSFGETAARLGVKLVETRTGAVDPSNVIVAGGAYQRIRIETRLHGSFWSLLQYVDTIERSAQPMAIESLVMMADHDKSGTGELRMTASALYPVPPAIGSGATTGSAR